MNLLKFFAVIGLLSTVSFAAPLVVGGVTIDVTGSTVVTGANPLDFTVNDAQGANAQIYRESDRTLVSSINVNSTSNGFFSGLFNPSATLAAGTYSSFYVHFDTQFGGLSNFTLVFPFAIRGLAYRDDKLDNSDVFALAGSSFEGSRTLGLGDNLFQVNGNQITINLVNVGLVDDVRIITDAPEPATMGLMGAGLAGIAFLARRRKSA